MTKLNEHSIRYQIPDIKLELPVSPLADEFKQRMVHSYMLWNCSATMKEISFHVGETLSQTMAVSV